MQGPNNNILEHLDEQLLFKGAFTIELLNQLIDNYHISNEVTLSSKVCKTCTKIMLDGEIVRKWGHPVLVPHDTFLHKDNSQYVRSDSLYFRVSYNKADSLYNDYYYYIMQYLIRPSMAGVSMIFMAMVMQIFHIIISFDDDDHNYVFFSTMLLMATFSTVLH